MSSDHAPGANGTTSPAQINASATTVDSSRIAAQPESVTPTPDPSNPTTSSSQNSSKKARPQPKTATTADNIQEAGQGVKLTGAQLKKQKAAEKAARRAEKVALKGEQAQAEAAAKPSQAQKQRRPSQGAKSDSASNLATPTAKHQRRPSNQPPDPGAIRVPFRPGAAPTQGPGTPQPTTAHKPLDKKAPLASHLYPPRTTSASLLSSAPREIHPSILTLTIHTRSLTLAGSTSRTVALLLTLKRVIQSYTTPPGTALPRHLTTHLSHQLTFLSSSSRQLSIPQGNAIRWLKKLISQLDPDLDESDAKKFLCEAIDGFIREKLTLAGEMITSQACDRFEGADETIVVYGKSSVVERILLTAAREYRKRFRVIVVDSRPLFEGQNLARSLIRAGMCQAGELSGCEVVYTLLPGLADAVMQYAPTKCLLGAAGMMGNGSLYSRAGTAMVAMAMKEAKVPVLVCCESVKFTAKMAVDSLSLNEVGDADCLVEREQNATITVEVVKVEEQKSGGAKKKGQEEETSEGEGASRKGLLSDWQNQQGLYLLNLMYDVTPKELLDMVICELGTLPPGAVPVVKGDGGDE